MLPASEPTLAASATTVIAAPILNANGANSAVFDFQATGREESDGGGEGFALGGKYTSGELLGSVVVRDRNHALRNDRAVIVFVIDKVNRASADLCSASQDRFVNVMSVKAFPTECRNQ